MSLHFPALPKIRTFRFSLHTSRLSLHGEVTIVALKFAMSSHFPLPKKFALFVPTLSNGTSRATSDRKLKTNDQILPSPIIALPIEKINQINTTCQVSVSMTRTNQKPWSATWYWAIPPVDRSHALGWPLTFRYQVHHRSSSQPCGVA